MLLEWMVMMPVFHNRSFKCSGNKKTHKNSFEFYLKNNVVHEKNKKL